MESSNTFGDAEECQSSESGWTMYLGSPTNSGDDGDGDGDGDDDHADACRGVKPDDDSDDSMASDASSGPSHRSWGSGKHGQGMPLDKQGDQELDKVDGKVLSNKKASSPVKKNGNKKKKKKEEEEEESVLRPRGGNFSVHGSEKVRKNSWFIKRK